MNFKKIIYTLFYLLCVILVMNFLMFLVIENMAIHPTDIIDIYIFFLREGFNYNFRK